MPRTGRRVDVIVNRAARRLRDGALRERIVGTSALGATVHETHTLADLDEVARAIARRGTDVVVLCGGDGSYMAGVTALDRACARADGARGAAAPVIALAPGGTVGTVARNWGLRGRSAAVAERIVRAALEGAAPVIERPTLRVRDDALGDRVGFIFGAGLVANFFDVYYSLPPSQQGYAGAARIVARVFAGSFVGSSIAERVLTPVPARLSVDGACMAPVAWSLVVASVVRDLGLHMHVTHRAAERFDRFHVVASAEPPRALGPQMPRVLAGKPLRGAHHVDTLAADARLELASPRASYVLDGDPIAASDVRIAAGPIVRVLAP